MTLDALAHRAPDRPTGRQVVRTLEAPKGDALFELEVHHTSVVDRPESVAWFPIVSSPETGVNGTLVAAGLVCETVLPQRRLELVGEPRA